MSLILDAINRADQERSESSHSPNLQSSQSPEPKAKRPYVRWAIEALVVISLLVLLINQWLDTPSTTQPTADDTTEPLVQQVKPTVHKPAMTATQPQAPALQPNDAANNLSSQAVANIPIAKTPTTPAVRVAEAKADSSISALYNQSQVSQPQAVQKPSSQPVISQPLSQAVSTSTATTAKHNTPLLTDLPWRIQQKIPSIDFTQHNYSHFAGESTVELNKRLLKPGERVAAGLVLVSIDQEFITLNYQGTKFRLWALNSWVNFN